MADASDKQARRGQAPKPRWAVFRSSVALPLLLCWLPWASFSCSLNVSHDEWIEQSALQMLRNEATYYVDGVEVAAPKTNDPLADHFLANSLKVGQYPAAALLLCAVTALILSIVFIGRTRLVLSQLSSISGTGVLSLTNGFIVPLFSVATGWLWCVAGAFLLAATTVSTGPRRANRAVVLGLCVFLVGVWSAHNQIGAATYREKLAYQVIGQIAALTCIWAFVVAAVAVFRWAHEMEAVPPLPHDRPASASDTTSEANRIGKLRSVLPGRVGKLREKLMRSRWWIFRGLITIPVFLYWFPKLEFGDRSHEAAIFARTQMAFLFAAIVAYALSFLSDTYRLRSVQLAIIVSCGVFTCSNAFVDPFLRFGTVWLWIVWAAALLALASVCCGPRRANWATAMGMGWVAVSVLSANETSAMLAELATLAAFVTFLYAAHATAHAAAVAPETARPTRPRFFLQWSQRWHEVPGSIRVGLLLIVCAAAGATLGYYGYAWKSRSVMERVFSLNPSEKQLRESHKAMVVGGVAWALVPIYVWLLQSIAGGGDDSPLRISSFAKRATRLALQRGRQLIPWVILKWRLLRDMSPRYFRIGLSVIMSLAGIVAHYELLSDNPTAMDNVSAITVGLYAGVCVLLAYALSFALSLARLYWKSTQKHD